MSSDFTSPHHSFLERAEREAANMDSRSKILTREQGFRNEVQKFLQMHYSQCFSMDFLHRHLEIPLRDVEQICETLIAAGAAWHPLHTSYMQGNEVDWEAVHAGRATWPDWALEPDEARPCASVPLVDDEFSEEFPSEPPSGIHGERGGGNVLPPQSPETRK